MGLAGRRREADRPFLPFHHSSSSALPLLYSSIGERGQTGRKMEQIDQFYPNITLAKGWVRMGNRGMYFTSVTSDILGTNEMQLCPEDVLGPFTCT